MKLLQAIQIQNFNGMRYNLLKSDSHLPEKRFYLLQRQPFRNDEKCFLFHFKSSLNSQDSYIFVLSFRTCKKTGLIRKIRLISKISQPGQRRITINISLDISGIKGYQTIKFGQLVEYNKRNIFLPKSCKKRGKETSSRSLFGF